MENRIAEKTHFEGGLTVWTLEIAFVTVFETNMVLQLLFCDASMFAVLVENKKKTRIRLAGAVSRQVP